jgi:uncharacterized protein YbjT (DUF2867 family)
MANPLIAVGGATGNIGSELCRLLLAGGARVRALGRDRATLQRLGAVEPAPGSLDDAMGLGKALQGTDAVFAMVPPNLATTDYRGYCRRIVESWARGIDAAGVTHVVALSSIGAEQAADNGPIAALHELEERFAQLRANVLFLRPTYFLENHFAALGMIRGMNLYGSPMKGDLAIPMIATRDIAAVAAKRLLGRDFTGKTVLELLGAKEYTLADVARTLGKEIGKPDLPYVQFPEADAKQAMLGMGISENVAGLFLEMQRAFNDGRIRATQPRSSQTTTPTTLGQFAKQFAAAFKAGGPARR